MKPVAFLSCADRDAKSLLSAAVADWARPVPHCPGWDAAELVRHTGGILQWMAVVVTAGERVSRRDLPPAPERSDELAPWYFTALSRTLEVLSSANPDEETWTFSPIGDRRVGWWLRRLTVEVGIHRWDIEYAAALHGGAAPKPIDGEVAAAGIEEFVVEFLPGLLDQDAVDGVAGTLHLHATDGPTEWWIDLDAGGTALAEHARADCAIRGTRSDLLLWLTNRGPLDSLNEIGSSGTPGNWSQLRR